MYLIKQALAEDLGPLKRDITTDCIISPSLKTTAVMRARKAGVISGVDVAMAIFRAVDPKLKIKQYVENGDKVTKNNIIFSVSGSARSILLAERTALNFICHLSGIATLTRQYVEAIQGTKAKILDTRKTTPGLRILEKQAVKDGGGMNHRVGLYDAILIKDNHIKVSNSVKVAIKKARASASKGIQLVIEVDTLKQLAEVLQVGGADVVLLDNMDIKTLKKAVVMVAALPRERRPLTEASGGVSLKTVRAIAKTGVDRISIGALTHSAPILDVGLDVYTA